VFYPSSSQPFWHQELVSWRQFFHGPGLEWGKGWSTHTVLLYALFLVCGNLRIFYLDFRVRVQAPMESNATADLMGVVLR